MSKIIAAVFILSTVLILSSCGDDNPSNPPSGGAGTSYFPNGDGTYYKYDVISIDSAGMQEQGTRTSRYNGTQAIEGTNYQVQI